MLSYRAFRFVSPYCSQFQCYYVGRCQCYYWRQAMKCSRLKSIASSRRQKFVFVRLSNYYYCYYYQPWSDSHCYCCCLPPKRQAELDRLAGIEAARSTTTRTCLSTASALDALALVGFVCGVARKSRSGCICCSTSWPTHLPIQLLILQRLDQISILIISNIDASLIGSNSTQNYKYYTSIESSESPYKGRILLCPSVQLLSR